MLDEPTHRKKENGWSDERPSLRPRGPAPKKTAGWMWVISVKCHEECDILWQACGWWKSVSHWFGCNIPLDTWQTIGYHWYMECRKPCLAKTQNHLWLLKVASAMLSFQGISSQKILSQTWENQQMDTNGSGNFQEKNNLDRISSWWFLPIWKILVKLDHFPK